MAGTSVVGAGGRWFAPVARSLSRQLFVLTVLFVLASQTVAYVVSVAGYHCDLLLNRLAGAQLAVLALEETPGNTVTDELRREMLANAGVEAIVLKRTDARTLFLREDMPLSFDRVYDTRSYGRLEQVVGAFDVLLAPAGRMVRIVGTPRLMGGEYIEVIMEETEIQLELAAYSQNVMLSALAISLVTAFLVYLILMRAFVRPMRRITENMLAFRERPEDARRIMSPSGRADEIGVAEATLAEMQADLRGALHQRAHLAALGASVAKINHDLRNILASAQLASDRLAASEDPGVKKLGSRLMAAIDRAVNLTTATLKYARAEETAPQRRILDLRHLVDEVFAAATPRLPADQTRLVNAVPAGCVIDADPDQLFRILLNLARNAVEVLDVKGGGRLQLRAAREGAITRIEVADTGPGLPEKARAKLFEPFAGSARAGGSGLGLAIAKELAIAHGGDLSLVATGPEGTTFEVMIPDREEG